MALHKRSFSYCMSHPSVLSDNGLRRSDCQFGDMHRMVHVTKNWKSLPHLR